LQKAVTLLQESFARTMNDRKDWDPEAPYNEDGSKKAGVLFIVNELFAIYFFLNTLRLCKNLLRPVESRQLHLRGSTSQMVTYRFYVGRLCMFEDQYAQAEEHLEYALNNCHKNAVRNKELILQSLVPVKLYRGRLPSAKREYGWCV
jgi:nuclear mRNA export protein PCID2/THP1